MKNELIPLDPPGRILFEEFIEPSGLSQKTVAERCGIAEVRLSEIVNGKRRISAETAIRLATFFKTSPELWLHLQADYDLRKTEREKGEAIRSKVSPVAA
jgi:addiction module HigA family antidote